MNSGSLGWRFPTSTLSHPPSSRDLTRKIPLVARFVARSSPLLRLDFCSHKAARYAVTHWHYSRQLPAGKLVKIGVWEDGAFCGSVIYSYGANRNMAKSLSMKQTEVCELTRVALKKGHVAPVSRILAVSLKML